MGSYKAVIVGVGTATTPNAYSQAELLDAFRISDLRVRSLFLNSSIDRRHLVLPPSLSDGSPRIESQSELIDKHCTWGSRIGADAVRACLGALHLDISSIKYLCCTTTTGFLTPGLSAYLCRELGLDEHCARLDVVGMGCNAGLNGLNATVSWALANPDKLALLLCVEICSAAYVFDGSLSTAVVNSLFGDGAAAVAVKAVTQDEGDGLPAVVDFSSLILTRSFDAMRFDWNERHGKFSFSLDQEIPYLIGAHVERAVKKLLAKSGVTRSSIQHWIIHSGGKKVIDSIRVNLGLTVDDMRHTSSVLRDYGNLSSGSFLYSYERLIEEGRVRRGEYGIMITMGPGATIETALLRW